MSTPPAGCCTAARDPHPWGSSFSYTRSAGQHTTGQRRHRLPARQPGRRCRRPLLRLLLPPAAWPCVARRAAACPAAAGCCCCCGWHGCRGRCRRPRRGCPAPRPALQGPPQAPAQRRRQASQPGTGGWGAAVRAGPAQASRERRPAPGHQSSSCGWSCGSGEPAQRALPRAAAAPAAALRTPAGHPAPARTACRAASLPHCRSANCVCWRRTTVQRKGRGWSAASVCDVCRMRQAH